MAKPKLMTLAEAKDHLATNRLKSKVSGSFKRLELRAEKYQQPLDFDKTWLSTLAARAMGTLCPYCDILILMTRLRVSNLALDHKTPLSRGGTNAKDNIHACCEGCNRLKGELTHTEFVSLLLFLKPLPAPARADISRRMKIGGKFAHATNQPNRNTEDKKL